jgi:hypothetical protein
MAITLKYKKIISSIIGLLIIPLMFAQLMAHASAQGCYKEFTDTSTGVTTLTLQSKCSNGTDYPNGDPINPNDCYYEETIQPNINSSKETVDEPENCTTLLCQGGPTLSAGKNCSSVDPCDPTPTNPDAAGSADCNNIVQNYINPIILFLGGGVGLIIVIMVVIGGIEFITSSGDPNHVAEAKKRIANALLALVTWIIIWAFLEWIIPGGLFH